jgi:hypothetical protein
MLSIRSFCVPAIRVLTEIDLWQKKQKESKSQKKKKIMGKRGG